MMRSRSQFVQDAARRFRYGVALSLAVSATGLFGDDLPWVFEGATDRAEASSGLSSLAEFDSRDGSRETIGIAVFDSRDGSSETSLGISMRTDPFRGAIIIFR